MTHLVEPYPWTKPMLVGFYVAIGGAVTMTALAILRHYNIGRMPSMRLSIGLAAGSASLILLFALGINYLHHPTHDYLAPYGSQNSAVDYRVTRGRFLISTIVRRPGWGKNDPQLAWILVRGDGHGLRLDTPRQEMLDRLIAFINANPTGRFIGGTGWVATRNRRVERAQAAIIHMVRHDRTLNWTQLNDTFTVDVLRLLVAPPNGPGV